MCVVHQYTQYASCKVQRRPCHAVQREPADFILKHKPAAVIFENSFSAAGGNGAIVSCTDKASQDGSLAVLSLCRLAAEMRSVTNAQQLEVGWQVNHCSAHTA